MSLSRLAMRVGNRLKSEASRRLGRRTATLRNRFPIVSFTFDDFPRSALTVGGAILRQHGFAGTYYTAFGLMGEKESPVGPIFVRDDLPKLLTEGHELGCHTFAHCHSWETSPRDFEKSIVENGEALRQTAPGLSFKSFSYPKWHPRPATKRRTGRHFSCCRGGGQIYNTGATDLNLLSAYFLEQGSMAEIEKTIQQNESRNGWLIFATHDISETPTKFGVTPDFLERVVKAAGAHGRVMRIGEAFDEAMAGGTTDFERGKFDMRPGSTTPATTRIA